MLEMLMLLGTGLVAAGVAGMTGIGSQPEDAVAVKRALAQDDLSEFGMGSEIRAGDDSLLEEVRRIGTIDVAGQPVTPVAFKVESDPQAIATEQNQDTPEMLAQEHVVADETAASSGTVHAEDVQPDSNDDIIFAVSFAMDEAVGGAGGDTAASDDAEVSEADSAEVEADAPEVILDFMAGQEKLSLHLPDDMGADTQMRIEQSGDNGADAAVVLEDALGSLTAAVIKGGFGSVTPDDIELEYAA